MNFIYKAIAILDLAIIVSTIPSAVYAQRSPNNPIQPVPQIQQQTESERLSLVENKPDLSLLAKTIVRYVKADAYQTESQMQMVANGSGASVTMNAKLNVITQYPNKFRAEINFIQPGGSTGIKYLVVSNGTNVLIYRPDSKKYAMTSYTKFDKSNESFLIGFSNRLFFTIPADMKRQISQGTVSNKEILGFLKLLNHTNFEGHNQSVEGKEYYVYDFNQDEKYTFRGFVEPTNATLNQLEISGKYQGWSIGITEKITNRVENPVINADTFKVTPPKGANQVKSLPINPY